MIYNSPKKTCYVSFTLCVIAFICIVQLGYCQSNELARIEYSYIPQANSDNVFQRFRISGNLPFKIDDKGSYLVMGMQYRYLSLSLKDEVPFGKDDMEQFQVFGVDLGYTFKMNDTWRFGARIGVKIASNFESDNLTSDDFRYTGAAYFIKENKGEEVEKPSRLILGLRYSRPASIDFPLPIINYYKKFQPNWSYSLGTPKTSLKYFATPKQTVQVFIGLDRFYSNIQQRRSFVDDQGVNQVVANASMLNILGALGYEYYFTKHLLLYIYTGHTISNEIRIRDEDQNNVHTINNKNTFYARGGIKFKL